MFIPSTDRFEEVIDRGDNNSFGAIGAPFEAENEEGFISWAL